jgi:hypothetical protein
MTKSYANVSADEIREFADEKFGAERFNADMSSGKDARYGNNGSIVVNLTGRWKGRFKDFEHDTSGWVLPEELQPKRSKRSRSAAQPSDGAVAGETPADADAPLPEKGRAKSEKLDPDGSSRRSIGVSAHNHMKEIGKWAASARGLLPTKPWQFAWESEYRELREGCVAHCRAE